MSNSQGTLRGRRPANLVHALRTAMPHRFKRTIKRLIGVPQTRLHSDWRILSAIGPRYDHHLVIDVGAHHGWFFHCWLDWCPQAEVHAFEPSGESFVGMRSLYGDDPRVNLIQTGVGATNGEMNLNILTASKVSNSFLVPDREVWAGIEYHTGEIEQECVRVVALDAYCAERGIGLVYLIKIDVQGFENEVIKGAGRVLARTDYVFVEAGIERLYEGAPSFAEVYLEMEKRGFHLMTMRAWHRGNHRLVETDMLFRRDDLAPDIDRQTDRHYIELK